MTNSMSLSLPLALLLLFFSFPSSNAHDKPPGHHQHDHVPSPAASTPKTADYNYKGCFKKVYAFGDSYTDTGNAYLLGGLKTFIGSLLSHLPFGSNPELSQQKGRLCDGRLVVDFLCEALALPYLSPYKKVSADFSGGANFAIAGSTSLSADFFIKKLIARSLMWQAIPQNFHTQIDWYGKYLRNTACKGKDDVACRAELEHALFWIGGMGINDYARTIGTAISARWLSENTISNSCKLIEALLAKGAKYLVVQGLPPVGCLPVSLLLSPPHDRDNMGCAAGINSVIMAHNDLLQRKLTEYRKQFPNCVLVYADYYNAYRAILMNATSQFQFKEPFKACCGTGGGKLNCNLKSICGAAGTAACDDPSTHIVWDGVHLTETMHQHLADLMLNKGFSKPSFHELIRRKKRVSGSVSGSVSVSVGSG